MHSPKINRRIGEISTQNRLIQTMIYLCCTSHKQDSTFLLLPHEQNTSAVDVNFLSVTSTICDFVKERTKSIYNVILDNIPSHLVQKQGWKYTEILDFFQDSESYSVCPTNALALDKFTAQFQFKFMVQLILWTYISPSCRTLIFRVLHLAMLGCEENEFDSPYIMSDNDLWDWLFAFVKCVCFTATTAAKTKTKDTFMASTISFLFVPSAIQCSLKPFALVGPCPMPNSTQSQISMFTHALVQHLNSTQDMIILSHGNSACQSVEVAIPYKLRADYFFQVMWNHNRPHDAAGCGSKKGKIDNADTSVSVELSSQNQALRKSNESDLCNDQHAEIQNELQLLWNDMHEICDNDGLQFEDTVHKFIGKHILPEVKNVKMRDESRAIGFVYLVTQYCLSHHIDQDDPLFYVQHAIFSAAVQGKIAGTTNTGKKWLVFCAMIYPDDAYSDTKHPLSHYIANCVGKKQIVPPKNDALRYYQKLYEDRCISQKKDRKVRHVAMSLRTITSHGKSSFDQDLTPKSTHRTPIANVPGKQSKLNVEETNVKFLPKKREKSNPAKLTSNECSTPKSKKKITKKGKRSIQEVRDTTPRRSPRRVPMA